MVIFLLPLPAHVVPCRHTELTQWDWKLENGKFNCILYTKGKTLMFLVKFQFHSHMILEITMTCHVMMLVCFCSTVFLHHFNTFVDIFFWCCRNSGKTICWKREWNAYFSICVSVFLLRLSKLLQLLVHVWLNWPDILMMKRWSGCLSEKRHHNLDLVLHLTRQMEIRW